MQLIRIMKFCIIIKALEEEREGSAIYLESLWRPGKEALGVTFIALIIAAGIKI